MGTDCSLSFLQPCCKKIAELSWTSDPKETNTIDNWHAFIENHKQLDKIGK
ncbi:hypothetical protein BRADI_1g25325v3 [Brachypodium distachyon]|uniref:Uncharacterized protein n=1 Tax=Brachypodium distachyon TaxID=15368 RepID=A0A2K2DL08_BRADI|nr:hypothetical protein BRADI_1g25325v3 [Brachypodium distachyon]